MIFTEKDIKQINTHMCVVTVVDAMAPPLIKHQRENEVRKISVYHLVIFACLLAQLMPNGCSFPPDVNAMTDAKEMVKKRITQNGGMIYNYSIRPIDPNTIDCVNTQVVASRGNLFMVEVTAVATDVSGIRLTQYCLAVVEVVPNSDSYYFKKLSCVFTSDAPITSEDIQGMKDRNGWDQWTFQTGNSGAD